MSEHHHHHPHEGHGEGNPPDADEAPLRHNWFFYVAGFFIAIALVCYILSINFNIQPGTLPSRPPASNAADK